MSSRVLLNTHSIADDFPQTKYRASLLMWRPNCPRATRTMTTVNCQSRESEITRHNTRIDLR